MNEERLLERIRRMEQTSGKARESSPTLLKQSITRHLVQLLNTRQGSAQIAQDYGIPDFTNILSDTGPQSMETMARWRTLNV